MRILMFLLTIFCALAQQPIMAATSKVYHVMQVYQAVPTSGVCPRDRGYLPPGPSAATDVPGVLSIDPGEDWSNFVRASASPAVPYIIRTVTVSRRTPAYVSIDGQWAQPTSVGQRGPGNIRLWWPLIYEIPGTTFTLTIHYLSRMPFDDDGPGPNPASREHEEIWVWVLGADVPSLRSLLRVLHTLPSGLHEPPLISDEALFRRVDGMLWWAEAMWQAGDIVEATWNMADAELALMDSAIAVAPASPGPGGPGTGIINTREHPACSILLTDIEWILMSTG